MSKSGSSERTLGLNTGPDYVGGVGGGGGMEMGEGKGRKSAMTVGTCIINEYDSVQTLTLTMGELILKTAKVGWLSSSRPFNRNPIVSPGDAE